jgi:hypothetical protein
MEIIVEFTYERNFGVDMKKEKSKIQKDWAESDPLKQPEKFLNNFSEKSSDAALAKPNYAVGEYNIYRALEEAAEKLSHSGREISRRTIYHHALTILKTKKSATESPKVFEGEHEYRAWLKSKGMIEVDNDAYVSQTGLRKKFSSMD